MADEERIGFRELFPDEPSKRTLLALDSLYAVMADENAAKGFVVWDATPPAGVTFTEHKQTFLDAVETALAFLHTNYRDEILLLGPIAASVVRTLPQFVEDEPVDKNRCIYLGKLGRKLVYADPKMQEAHGWAVLHRGDWVKCIIQNSHVVMYRPL